MCILQTQSFKTNQSGATAVEFALIALVFLTLIFGIFEAGRLFWTQNAIQYAIEVAARDRLVDPDLSVGEIEDAADAILQDMLISPANFTVTADVVTDGTYTYLEIDGTYQYDPVMDVLIPANWANIVLEASARRPLVWE